MSFVRGLPSSLSLSPSLSVSLSLCRLFFLTCDATSAGKRCRQHCRRPVSSRFEVTGHWKFPCDHPVETYKERRHPYLTYRGAILDIPVWSFSALMQRLADLFPDADARKCASENDRPSPTTDNYIAPYISRLT